jgi:hypothetical protein
MRRREASVKSKPSFRWLACALLVNEFTGAFLLADWSIGGWKSAGKARKMAHEIKDMTKLFHRAGLEDLFRRIGFHSGQNNP